MENFDIRTRVEPLLEMREKIRWTGASAPLAYIASHVPLLCFSAMIAFLTMMPAMRSILRLDISGIDMFSGFLFAFGGIVSYISIRNLLIDINVGWVITDKRVYKITRAHVTMTDIRQAVSIETKPRNRGAGDITVHLPERHDVDGDKTYPSVQMRDVDDLMGASAAITAALAQPLRSV